MVKHSKRLDSVFVCLSHPVRRAMVAALTAGEKTVGQLSEPLEISPPAVSKHLRVLERAGLLKQVKRGRERWCRLRTKPLTEAENWLGRQRLLWESSLDSFAEYAREWERKPRKRTKSREP